MHRPLAACLALGHARLTLVEQVERVIDGVANLALGRGGNAFAGVERGVDGGFESGSGHCFSLGRARLEAAFSEFEGTESTLVVPAKAGTHTAESRDKAGQEIIARKATVGGYGSRLARCLSSGAHSRDPLAWPGRQ